MSLKPHQLDALRRICSRGSLPLSAVDKRTLRPLARLGLVERTPTRVRSTPAGELAARGEREGPAAAPPHPRGSAAPGALSESQERILRYLLRQPGPVPVDHLDGRVVRALQSRGLVEEKRGWVSATASANEYLQGHADRVRHRARRKAASSARGARSEAILRATQALEDALPRNTELMIGSVPAYADDVVAGLRKLARELE